MNSPSLRPIVLGQHRIERPLMLAPMAGITDMPFRRLCHAYGAGYSVSEMLTSQSGLEHTPKSFYRRQLDEQAAIKAIQIVGYDPSMLAEAAQQYEDIGADVVDINMGCPAKKVCNVASGSALLRDESLVAAILERVVNAVNIPVTLKIRTGWCPDSKNAIKIAKIAEQSGVSMLTIHGRTRADKFKGEAEYDTIAQVVDAVDLPIIANGDITSVDKAKAVLARTGAHGLMIGRGAQGQPWIFSQIASALGAAAMMSEQVRESSELSHQQAIGLLDQPVMATAPPITRGLLASLVPAHLRSMHAFYGEQMGVRMARKHLRWYLDNNAKRLKISELAGNFWHTVCRVDNANDQIRHVQSFFDALCD